MTRKCKICGQEKTLDLFPPDKNSKEQRRWECKVCRAIAQRARRKKMPAIRRWHDIKSRAKRRGIPFKLNLGLFRKWFFSQTYCHYCHIKTDPSIDRMVPEHGYVFSNIVAVCGSCNTIKSNIISYNQMIGLKDHLRAISEARGTGGTW